MDVFEKKAARVVAQDASDQGAIIPGFTVAVTSASGFKYARAFGPVAQDNQEPLPLDTAFHIASCTKIMTATAVMHAVEQGKLALDGDITTVLPEWKGVHVYEGLDKSTGKPITRPAKNTITLRQLLTHTSGMAYDLFDPTMLEYRRAMNMPHGRKPKIVDTFTRILLYEPGTIFKYSPGLDWAGLMLMRVSGITLGDYMQAHIFTPAGIPDGRMSFDLTASVKARRAQTSTRNPQTGRLEPTTPGTSSLWSEPEAGEREHMGGGGLISSAPDFCCVLEAIFLEEKILKPESLKEMFTPQYENRSELHRLLVTEAEKSLKNNGIASLPDEIAISYGISGLLTESDAPGQRSAGSLSWAGLPNCYWWADPKEKVVACIFKALLPTGQDQSVAVLRDFERAVYKEVRR